MTEAGTTVSLTWLAAYYDGGACLCKFGIYTDVSTYPTALIVGTAQQTVSAKTSYTVNTASAESLANGQNIWIAIGNSGGRVAVYYDSGSPQSLYTDAGSYTGTMDSSFPANHSHWAYILDAYLTYNASGAGSSRRRRVLCGDNR
jgi:hypothetical protein